MARLVMKSDTSWEHEILKSRKQFQLLYAHRKVATLCKLKNKTMRRFRISFEERCGLKDIVGTFKVASGLEIRFPPNIRAQFESVIHQCKPTYLTVEVLDNPEDNS